MQHDPDSDLSSLLTILRTVTPGSPIAPVVNETTINLTSKLLSRDPKDYVNIAEHISNNSDAEILLDFMLHLLCERRLSNPAAAIDINLRARRFLLKVATRTSVVPRSLMVVGNVWSERDLIGSGGFGHVFKGELRGVPVALKVLYKTNHNIDFRREALMWRSLNHNLVLPFLGIYENESSSFLVSPYMKNGTLVQWRKKAKPSIVEIQERILEVAQGMEYIHSEGVVHGDIRGDNILLDADLHVKIADFGLTRLLEATVTRSGALHLNFAAPELFGSFLDDDDDDVPARTQKSDVYAFGCLYYEIHYDTVPFAGKQELQILRLISRGVLPPRLDEPPLSNEAWNLIQRCWVSDASKRPVMKDMADGITAILDSDGQVQNIMKHPQPPAGTVKGYNPVMDQPRPTVMENYLRDFDVLFIIDDSGSMKGARWNKVRDALLEIAQYAQDLNVRSVSLRFMNKDIYDRGIQGRGAIISRFQEIKPRGGTPTGTVLHSVLNEHLDRIDRVVSNPAKYAKIPPLDIIVLTDGVASDDPARVIAKAVSRLRQSKYHPNTLRIHFVQIGDALEAKESLKKLVHGDNGGIVDTVPYGGVLTSAELQRIVLGGLDPNFRAMVPVSLPARGIPMKPTPPATMEIAKTMKPPPPPVETVKGYNPVMDQPRPSVMENYLRDFDVLFIIDDSGSMEGLRWYEARDALLEIAQYAQDLNVRSVSLRFMNCNIYDRGIQGRDAIILRFQGIIPIGSTPTGEVLDSVLNEHLDRIDRVASNPVQYAEIPPLDIIVLTDGMPSDDPASVIAKAVARLRKSKYHPNTMSVGFVQIGDEHDAAEALKQLAQGDNGGIVDAVPYRGVLTSAELQRIVLGGLHPNVRALVPRD